MITITFMAELRNHLNESQLEAVSSLDGPLLVIAGAGSGKTRVIEYRVLNLVLNGINPHSIVLLTFTRKASREMISRAARHNPLCKSVSGGTFHSFAYKILRRYMKNLGLDDSFFVIDEGDAEEAVHRCAVRLGLFEKEKRFPRKQTIRTILSMSVNKGIPLSEVVRKEYPHFTEYIPDLEHVRNDFIAFKIEKNFLDYDDLLVYLRILLEQDDVRGALARRYRYIMVDEYQDTNTLQGDIASLLAGEHRNIMVVGDDAQSIYGFRGATHDNIMRFPERFPGCRIVKLEENYRSAQPILDVANAVLVNMKNKYSKCLVSVREKTAGRPALLFFRDAYEECEFIAGQIKINVDEGVLLSRQCVLFRALYLSIPLQSELSRRNIPYETYGGIKFYETAHVKDLFAHLRLIANPKDELAWMRALMLVDHIGPKTAERIAGAAVRCPSLPEILETVIPPFLRKGAFSEGLAKLSGMLAEAYRKRLSLDGVFEEILAYYQPRMKEKFDDWHFRINDLDALRQIASRYRSISDLVADFSIEAPERGTWKIEPETKEEDKPLVISTIHSAKGLEWDCVFLMGMMDGVLPVTFSLDSDEGIEEEMRLLYVALTRARNRLFLSLHHQGFRGGITQFNRISRFLEPSNVREKLDLRSPVVGGIDEIPDDDGNDGTFSIFNKKSLFRRLVDFSR